MGSPFAVYEVGSTSIVKSEQIGKLGQKNLRARSNNQEFSRPSFKKPVTGTNNSNRVRVPRHDPKYIVQIEGVDVDNYNLTKYIKDIEVHEFDDQMSWCKIDIFNENTAFTDDHLFKPQNKIEIWTGYGTEPLEKRGTFYLKKPSFKFRGTDTITLVGLSEEILMHQTTKRRTFKHVRDSDIATQIAIEYNLNPDVENTSTLYNNVSQMGQTDLEFLFERARLYGYVLKVHDGTLHFHQERKNDSGLTMVYRAGEEQSTLDSIDFVIDTSRRGGSFNMSQINPLSKEIMSIDSSDAPDKITEQVLSEEDEVFNRIESETTLKGHEVSKFLESAGHLETREELENIVQSYGEEDRWMLSGSGTCIGVQDLHAGSMINIMGVGRMSGKYLCKYVKHMLGFKKGYSIKFKVNRAWIGESTRVLKSVKNKLSNSPTRRSSVDSDILHDDATYKSSITQRVFDYALGKFIEAVL